MNDERFKTRITDDLEYTELLNEIYNRSKKKEDKITALIDQLKTFITDHESALMLVPLISEYLNISVKNDDQLVKLATVVQRIVTSKIESSSGDDGFILTEEERKEIMNNIDELKNDIPENKIEKK